MGKIIISENVSLDGVIQDPSGDEGFRHGGWIGRIGDRGREEAAKVALDEALGTEAMLLGRRSYEFLASRWPSRTGALADRLNSKPKYVVSSTLQDPAWNNTTVLHGDVVNEISKLKQQINGDIVVAASFQLLHTLLEHDLADELRLMIYPVVLGTGKRLVGETSDKKPMRLVECDLGGLSATPIANTTDPAAVPEALVTGRVLDDSVERDVFAHDDLSHIDSPSDLVHAINV